MLELGLSPKSSNTDQINTLARKIQPKGKVHTTPHTHTHTHTHTPRERDREGDGEREAKRKRNHFIFL